jgi:hypothetical protein
MAARRRWTIGTFDIEAAFLNSKPVQRQRTVERELVRLPAMTTALGLVAPWDSYAWVERSVYGRPESPRDWAVHRDRQLRTMNFGPFELVQGESDRCIWTIVNRESRAVVGFFCTYVDDFCVMGEDATVDYIQECIEKVWKLSSSHRVSVSGGSATYCGFELSYRDEGGSDGKYLNVSQEKYTFEVLRRYNMEKCSPAATPADMSDMDDAGDADAEGADLGMVREAQEIVGALTWLAVRSRPDISRATSRAAEAMLSMPEVAIRRGKRILRYLRGSISFALRAFCDWKDVEASHNAEEIQEILQRYTVDDDEDVSRIPEFDVLLRTYADASFAPTAKKSVGGTIIFNGSMPVVWKSGKQPLIAESSCESEMLQQGEASVMALGIVAVAEDFGQRALSCQRCDSRAALLQVAGGASWRTRHHAVRAAALRERVKTGQMTLSFIPGELQVADGLTKSLGGEKHRRFVKYLNMCPSDGCYQSPSYMVQPIAIDARGDMSFDYDDIESPADGEEDASPNSDTVSNIALKTFRYEDFVEPLVRGLAAGLSSTIGKELQCPPCPQCPTLVCDPCEPCAETSCSSAAAVSGVVGALTVAGAAMMKFCKKDVKETRNVGIQAECSYQNGRFQYLGRNGFERNFEAQDTRIVSSGVACCKRRKIQNR